MARGLTDVGDRPAVQMMPPNLVRHHRLPPSASDGDRHGCDRGGAAPSAPSPTDAFRRAALATPGSVDRPSSGLANQIDRADGLACERLQDVDFGIAWSSPRFWSQAPLAAPETWVFDDDDRSFQPTASASNSRSTANAANSTKGSPAIRIGRHMGRSIIHAGSSSQ